MSFYSGTCEEVMMGNAADATAVASTASETSLLGGLNEQPTIPLFHFDGAKGFSRRVRLTLEGIFSVTGTPTMTFQVRNGTVQGVSDLSGTIVGQSVPITTINNVANAWFQLVMNLTCRVIGQGTGNTTISGSGHVWSPAGFASPFTYLMVPASGSPAAWTTTMNNVLTAYVNPTLTWSASSPSNTCTVKDMLWEGLN